MLPRSSPRYFGAKTVPKIQLTDLTVQSLTVVGTYFDKKTPSFGIRVGKNRKTWMVMHGRSRTRIRLGHYPAVSLSEAKKKAHAALGQEAPEAKTAVVFEDAVRKFLAEHYQGKKPRTAHEAQRLLTSHRFKVEIEEAPERNVHGFKGYRLKQAQLTLV